MASGARDVAARQMRRLLAALEPGRTVMLSEYPLRPRARWGWGSPPHAALDALLAKGVERYAGVIDRLVALLPELSAIDRTASPPAPSWDNDWWAGLDAAVHVEALLGRRPATYLEVGSGCSTMFARHAVERAGLPTRIVSIDPSPRAEIDALCDEVVRSPLEEADPGVWDRLAPGDVVLVDGSHMATMGCDTVVALLEVVPRLPAGVLVGIDDVFLPFDYHPTWTDRWYGEQYVLAAYLLGGGDGYEVAFPAMYATRHGDLSATLEPLWPVIESRFGRVASSFWIERPGP
jgi:hypothetical protein